MYILHYGFMVNDIQTLQSAFEHDVNYISQKRYTAKLLFHQSLMRQSPLLTASSTVTTQVINFVVTVLLAVVSGDFTVTVQSRVVTVQYR